MQSDRSQTGTGDLAAEWVADRADLILITGATGFIGVHVLQVLLEYGFVRIRCLVRSAKRASALQSLASKYRVHVDFLQGDLLSKSDCLKACDRVAVIYHLAVGATGKSFAGAVMNVVVPTRNLLEAGVKQKTLKRFVNVSSFAVYSNQSKPRPNVLDEACPLDERPLDRGDAYAFAKLKQDQLVAEYAARDGFDCVTVRPGTVYGPGKSAIPGRVGIDTFGIFLHLGGPNRIPLTYVSNCAEAIVMSGLVKRAAGQTINVVDDHLPSSRQFLKLYKRDAAYFRSLYVPHFLSYAFCWLWEKYVVWSQGQLPPKFSRGEWHAYWKKTDYSNQKLKEVLGWTMQVPTAEGLKRYFEFCKQAEKHA